MPRSLSVLCLILVVTVLVAPGLPLSSGFQVVSNNLGESQSRTSLQNTIVVDQEQSTTSTVMTENPSIVQQCFDAFNNQDLDLMMDCFEEDCNYEDTLFDKGIRGSKTELRTSFQRILDTGFPPKVVLDKIASCSETGKIGTQWHLETGSGIQLPFSKGCSFYTTNPNTGKIQTGFRVMESPLKPDDAIFNLLIIPLKIAESFSSVSTSNGNFQIGPDASIVEKAYHRWNDRDMEGAAKCFSDNAVLEDTLYFNPIRGNKALKEHYARIASQLPNTCKIFFDDIVVDQVSGNNIATLWHLESGSSEMLSGWSRGCSMYSTSLETGLITSGLDVTESPAKVNEPVFDLLLKPFQFFNNNK